MRTCPAPKCWAAWIALWTIAGAFQLDWGAQGSKATASDEGKLVPVSSNSREDANGRQLLSAPCRDMVLIGMLDGSIAALDSDTGQNLWSFQSGSPLVASSLNAHGNHGEQAVPGVDGSLYFIKDNRDSKIERMPISIPELVETSPSLTADGSLIIGSQHAEMYYLDLGNGKLLQKFSSDGKSMGVLDSSLGGNMEDQRILLLGRQNYNVYSVDQLSGFIHWNVSYSHITHLDVKGINNGVGVAGFLDGKRIASISSVKDAPYFHLSSDNTVHSLDPTTGWTKWIMEFEHPPVAVYSPSAAGFAESSMVGKFPHPRALQGPMAWDTRTPKQQMSTPSKIIMGSVDGQFYALPTSYKDSNDIPSSLPDHLVGTQVMEVEDALVKDRDSLSCLLGVSDLALSDNSDPREQSFHIAPEVLQGELQTLFIYIFGLASAIMFIYIFRRMGQKKTSATTKTTPIVTGCEESQKPEKTNIEPSTPLSIGTSINAVPPSTHLVSNEPSTISSTSTVSSSRATDMRSSQVGQLSFGPGILGYGTAGTVVFEGVFHGRSVAVKRLLKQFYDLAANEKDILILSDENPNLIRLYAMEEDDQFVYLALERCQASLASLMGSREGRKMLVGPKGAPTAQCMTIIQDMANGLDALHERGVVHRDVKPHNVLITDNGRAKLSDMGLGRRLVADQSSFYSIGSGGSSGWQAPEQLIIRDGGAARQTKTMDVFSLGCVMYYCLTGGGHPFGNSSYERDVNILKGEPFLRPLRDIPEAFHLIREMLQVNPRRRPMMKRVLSHPFWWSPRKRLQFFVDLSDRIENEDRRDDKSLLWAFEGCSVQATGGNWGARLDPLLISNLGQYRKYNYTSLKDLLRVIRNKHNHFREMPTELKELLSPQPDGFLRYFTSRFPHLLLTIYLFAGNRLSKDTPLSKYFPDYSSEGMPKQIAELNEDDLTIQAIKDERESTTVVPHEQTKNIRKKSYESRISLDPDGFMPVKSGINLDRSHSSLRIRTNSAASAGPGAGSLSSTGSLHRKVHTGTGWDSVFDIIRENANRQADAPQISVKRAPSSQKGWTDKTEAKQSMRFWNGVQVPDGFFSSPSSSSIDNSGSSPAERYENGYSGSLTPAVTQDQHPRGFDALVSDARQRMAVSPNPKSDDDPYKDLQSPVKLSNGIRQYERPDMPIVGWEQSPSNSVHTVLRFPRRPGMQLCDFYMKTGFCKYHDKCKFDHPPDYAIKLNEDGLPMRPGEPVCDFYKSTHACKFGGACKFHHPNMQPIYAGSETNDTPQSGRDADLGIS